MPQVELTSNGYVVDASVIADAFGLDVQNVQQNMRNGKITSLSETGTDEDAGRARLTFYYKTRALRLVVNAAGQIIKQSRFPVASRDALTSVPAGLLRTGEQP